MTDRAVKACAAAAWATAFTTATIATGNTLWLLVMSLPPVAAAALFAALEILTDWMMRGDE